MQSPVAAFPGIVLAAALVAVAPAAANDPIVIAQAEPNAEGTDAEPEPSQSAPPPAPRRGIEEIVVHGDESDAVSDLESGDSVTGFDASDLEALGAQSIEDIASFTPNLEIVTSGSTSPTFFIRGVGLNDFAANSAGAVAIYQDDVPRASPALQLGTLFDVEGVNVLRGPQGTGQARNASAGAIKIYSRRPSGGFGGFLRAEIGNFNSRDYQGAIEMPVYEDILSARFSFRLSERDGYVKNRCGSAPPPDQREIRPNTRPIFMGDTLFLRGRGSAPNERGDDPTTEGAFSICGENVPQTAQFFDDPDDAFSPPDPRFRQYVPGTGISPLPTGLADDMNDRGTWAARGVFLFRPTLDMEWTLIAAGARRDELSRVGQAIGTGTSLAIPGCTPVGPVCSLQGALGGVDSRQYQSLESILLRNRLNPCVDAMGQSTGCTTAERRQATLDAALAGAEILADLDDEPWEGDYNLTGPTTNDVWGLSLKGEMALGDSLTLELVSGYDTYDRAIISDLDFSAGTLFEIGTEDTGWQAVQSLTLSGAVSEELPIEWSIGGYYLREELDVIVDANFFSPLALQNNGIAISHREYTQDLDSWGAFWSFAWDFWDDFTLDGGVRFNWERKVMDYDIDVAFDGQIANPNSASDSRERIFQAPTGEIRLTYRFREDTHAYWKYTRGFKGGHFNASGSIFTKISTAEPEVIDSFELGLRGAWFQGRLGLQGSLFHYNYENYQIFTAQQRFGGNPEFVVINANNAEVYGAEIDLVGRPLPGTYLQVRFSWLESQFLDYVTSNVTSQEVSLCSAETGFCTQNSETFDTRSDNSGNRLLNSPQFKVSLTAEQTIPLGRFGSLSARWDGAWTADNFYDATSGRGIPSQFGDLILPENTIAQDAYWIHNLRLGYLTPDGTVEIAGWVRNLENVAYKTFAFDASSVNATTIYFVGEPRTYGVSVTTTF